MNQSITAHYASARQDEIQRRVAARRVADEWRPAPPGNLADRVGRGLVHLGTRFMSDRQIAHRVERQIQNRAA
jgi:hypothetical protein